MTVQEMETKLNEAANLVAEASDICDEVLSEFDYPGVDLDEIQEELLYAMFPYTHGDYADPSGFVSTYGDLLEKINTKKLHLNDESDDWGNDDEYDDDELSKVLTRTELYSKTEDIHQAVIAVPRSTINYMQEIIDHPSASNHIELHITDITFQGGWCMSIILHHQPHRDANLQAELRDKNRKIIAVRQGNELLTTWTITVTDQFIGRNLHFSIEVTEEQIDPQTFLTRKIQTENEAKSE